MVIEMLKTVIFIWLMKNKNYIDLPMFVIFQCTIYIIIYKYLLMIVQPYKWLTFFVIKFVFEKHILIINQSIMTFIFIRFSLKTK